MLITLCNQNEFLLAKQIESLKNKFVNEGGWTENLYKERINQKYKKS